MALPSISHPCAAGIRLRMSSSSMAMKSHTKALAYVPSIPKRGIGGFVSGAAAAAYPLKAVLGAVLLARAMAGRASREDIIVAVRMALEVLRATNWICGCGGKFDGDLGCEQIESS